MSFYVLIVKSIIGMVYSNIEWTDIYLLWRIYRVDFKWQNKHKNWYIYINRNFN